MNSLEELIEFHENSGTPATFIVEAVPGVPEEDLGAITNMVVIATGTPTQIATIKAILGTIL